MPLDLQVAIESTKRGRQRSIEFGSFIEKKKVEMLLQFVSDFFFPFLLIQVRQKSNLAQNICRFIKARALRRAFLPLENKSVSFVRGAD